MAADPSVSQVFSAGLLAIGIATFGLACCFLFARRTARTADAEMRETWDTYMAETKSTLPDYDGNTYDWPETGLARYLSDTADDLPVLPLPVPSSDISGSLPTQPLPQEYDPAADAAAYIEAMTAQTTAFLAQIGAGE
jgi:hypothetical protein